MNGKLLYLDSSAILKTLLSEEGSAELCALLREWPEHVSSALARVEVRRVLRRATPPLPRNAIERGEQSLRRVTLIGIDDAILNTASLLEPPALRSMDAIHLATALSMQGNLQALITYDRRMAEAASQAGLTVWPPGTQVG